MSNSTKEIASKSNERFKHLKKDTWNCLSWTCNHLVALLIPILGSSHEYVMLRDNFWLCKKQSGKLRQGPGET